MAYRRRHGITRASTFKEDIYDAPDDKTSSNNSSYCASPLSPSPSSSLAAQAIRASARDSSRPVTYGDNAFHSSFKYRSKTSSAKDYATMRSASESGGFWGVLARKAKLILDEDNISGFESPRWTQKQELIDNSLGDDYQSDQSPDQSPSKMENPAIRKGLDALTTSLNQIGDTIGNALEEGRNIMENKTADILQETRKMQIRRKGMSFDDRNPWPEPLLQSAHPQTLTDQETQLKASRDVARATAAKAKQLLRELKTLKADLAFAKERCSQLEEENRILREAHENGDYPADDDMIRLQLETLLAEKARLAHENSIYQRENCVLREIVEYHQLKMQDVVYLDEGIEEVTEVYPIPAVSRTLSVSPPSPSSPRSPTKFSPSTSPLCAKGNSKAMKDGSPNESPPSSGFPTSEPKTTSRQ